jgi:hypothetical protein
LISLLLTLKNLLFLPSAWFTVFCFTSHFLSSVSQVNHKICLLCLSTKHQISQQSVICSTDHKTRKLLFIRSCTLDQVKFRCYASDRYRFWMVDQLRVSVNINQGFRGRFPFKT